MLDLSKPSSAKFIKEKIDSGNVFFIPMAPPCGIEHPSGLPGLSGEQLIRVELANACYETAAEVFKYGHARKVYAFIENPKNSYMWWVPCIAALFNLERVFFSTCHVCMHGGDRDKQTSLLHNCEALRQLEVRCDGSHTHKSWSVSKSLDGGWKMLEV